MHIDIKDIKPFESSDDFFEWYIPIIKGFVPALKTYVLAQRSKSIVKRIPELSKEQTYYMFKKIREIINVPESVYFVYSPSMETWASTFNRSKKRLEIIIPTYGYYMTTYPQVIKAAIQHEMGHLLNKDYLVQLTGHSGCVNRCMDCRINAEIDKQALVDLYDATYNFRAKPVQPIMPETWFPMLGLPVIEGANYSWKTIHEYYHYNDTDKPVEKKKPKETYVKDPEVGDIIQVRKGEDEGVYGRVVDIDENGESIIEEMSEEEVSEYFNSIVESNM